MTVHLHIDTLVLHGQAALDPKRLASRLREAALPEVALPEHVLLDVARAVTQAVAQRRKENP